MTRPAGVVRAGRSTFAHAGAVDVGYAAQIEHDLRPTPVNQIVNPFSEGQISVVVAEEKPPRSTPFRLNARFGVCGYTDCQVGSEHA